MTNFSFNANIPGANNDPADDQSLMQTNFSSTSGIVAIDHVGFNTANGGQHLQVTLPGNNVPGAQSGLASTIYSNAGTAHNTTSQLFFKNADVAYQISPVRAWGFCNTGGVIASQSVNVTSVSRSGAGNYVVTLTAGAVTTSNFAVIVSSTMNSAVTGGSIAGYTITGPGTFQLNFRSLTAASAVDPDNFSFLVLQL